MQNHEIEAFGTKRSYWKPGRNSKKINPRKFDETIDKVAKLEAKLNESRRRKTEVTR